MTYRTLGELKAEVLARLGMGAMGASGGANGTLITSFLRNGQAQLYRMQDWKHLTDYADLTLGVDQNTLGYPATGTMGSGGCQRDQRILRIETVYNGQWRELEEGIKTEDWSTMDQQSWPAKYERFRQMLFYPKANQAYTIRVWFLQDLGRFTEDNDRASLDDELILLHATANAKSHYRQPDAETYQGQLNTMLASLRGQSFRRVYRRDEGGSVMAKPAVVGRDV